MKRARSADPRSTLPLARSTSVPAPGSNPTPKRSRKEEANVWEDCLCDDMRDLIFSFLDPPSRTFLSLTSRYNNIRYNQSSLTECVEVPYSVPYHILPCRRVRALAPLSLLHFGYDHLVSHAQLAAFQFEIFGFEFSARLLPRIAVFMTPSLETLARQASVAVFAGMEKGPATYTVYYPRQHPRARANDTFHLKRIYSASMSAAYDAAMIAAISADNSELVAHLLRHRTDVGHTLVVLKGRAINYSAPKTLEMLHTLSRTWTPELDAAVRTAALDTDIIRFLVRYRLPIYANYALRACEGNNVEILRMVFDLLPADPAAHNSMIAKAVQYNAEDCIGFLLDKGVVPSDLIMDYALTSSKRLQSAQLLVAKGALGKTRLVVQIHHLAMALRQQAGTLFNALTEHALAHGQPAFSLREVMRTIFPLGAPDFDRLAD